MRDRGNMVAYYTKYVFDELLDYRQFVERFWSRGFNFERQSSHQVLSKCSYYFGRPVDKART